MRDLFLRGSKAPRNPRIYQKRLRRPEGGVPPGEVVAVRRSDGSFVGRAFYSPHSVVGARILDRCEQGPPIDADWFRERIRAAARLRTEVLRLPETTDAWRVVHAEGDGLSGLVIDHYAGTYVVELGSRGMFEHLDEIEQALDGPTVVRADARIQEIEGFSVRDRHAEPVQTRVREHGLQYHVDCSGGHKTGFFLDQREARLTVSKLARGRTVLDLCCYTGAFALAAARGGARSVTAVDLDETALDLARRNAELNGLQPRFVHADVFEFLRGDKKADLILLDPPKLARTRRDLPDARRKSVDLQRLALGSLTAGGLLFTFSCTGLVGPQDFLGHIREAAERPLRLLAVTGQPPDHPVHLDCPESRYLTGVLLEAI